MLCQGLLSRDSLVAQAVAKATRETVLNDLKPMGNQVFFEEILGGSDLTYPRVENGEIRLCILLRAPVTTSWIPRACH